MNLTIIILSLIVALAVSSIAYPFVIKFAKKHNIVDNPNARKLQREPIPVLVEVAAEMQERHLRT